MLLTFKYLFFLNMAWRREGGKEKNEEISEFFWYASTQVLRLEPRTIGENNRVRSDCNENPLEFWPLNNTWSPLSKISFSCWTAGKFTAWLEINNNPPRKKRYVLSCQSRKINLLKQKQVLFEKISSWQGTLNDISSIYSMKPAVSWGSSCIFEQLLKSVEQHWFLWDNKKRQTTKYGFDKQLVICEEWLVGKVFQNIF